MLEIVALESKKTLKEDEAERKNNRSNFLTFLRLLLISVLIAGSLAVFIVWQISAKTHRTNNSKILLDDVLTSPIQPRFGKTIFFHKTNQYNRGAQLIFLLLSGFARPKNDYRFRLTPREACAVESAALHNPNQDIFVLHESPQSWINNNQNSLTATIHNISNVYFRNLHLKQYMLDTPFASLIEYLDSPAYRYLTSKIARLLGFLSVFRYGGTYLDMDTITLQNFDDLGTNFAVFNKEKLILTSKIFSLSPYDIGFPVAINLAKRLEMYLQNNPNSELGADFFASKVLFEIFAKLCQSNDILKMQNRSRCHDLKVYDEKIFYGIQLSLNETEKSQIEFESTVIANEENWYATYDWQNFFNSLESETQFLGPYAWLAAEHCPKVFEHVAYYEKWFYGLNIEELLAKKYYNYNDSKQNDTNL